MLQRKYYKMLWIKERKPVNLLYQERKTRKRQVKSGFVENVT